MSANSTNGANPFSPLNSNANPVLPPQTGTLQQTGGNTNTVTPLNPPPPAHSPPQPPQKTHQGGAGPTQKTPYQPSTAVTVGKVVAVSLIVTTLVIGALALLVYLGELNVALTKVGTLSKIPALYATLISFGIALITTGILFVFMCWRNAQNKAQQAQPYTAPQNPLLNPTQQPKAATA